MVAPAIGVVAVGRVSVNGGTATVPVSCAGVSVASCTVTLSLSSVETLKGSKLLAVAARHRVKATKRTVVFARTTVVLDAGHSLNVHVPLNKTGQKLLKSRKTLAVMLTVASRALDGIEQTVYTHKLKLTEPRSKKPRRR